MQDILIVLEQLEQMDSNWLDKVLNKDETENIGFEVQELINNFFECAREEYKKNSEKIISFLEEKYDTKGRKLGDEIGKTLKIYYAISAFRIIQRENLDMGRKAVDFIFKNVIIRFDPGFHKEYSNYMFEKGRDLTRTAQVLNGLVYYYISQHYTHGAIKKDLLEETELSEEICSYIAKIIDDNYMQLQMNMVINEVND